MEHKRAAIKIQMETELEKKFEPGLEKKFRGGKKKQGRNFASLLLGIDMYNE
jgi:hypothetical protein